jgi:hypothetical protein
MGLNIRAVSDATGIKKKHIGAMERNERPIDDQYKAFLFN